MTSGDLRRKNAHLRDRIEQVLEKHPELRDVNEEVALRQDLHVRDSIPRTNTRQAARTSGGDNRASPRTRGLFRRLTAEGLPIPSPGRASNGGSSGKA